MVIQERPHSSVVSVSLMESAGFRPAIAYELSSLEPLNNELNLCISVSSSTNQSGLSYHKSKSWDSEDPNAYLWSKRMHWLNQKGGVEAERRGSQEEQQPKQKADVVNHTACYGNCMWFFNDWEKIPGKGGQEVKVRTGREPKGDPLSIQLKQGTWSSLYFSEITLGRWDWRGGKLEIRRPTRASLQCWGQQQKCHGESTLGTD